MDLDSRTSSPRGSDRADAPPNFSPGRGGARLSLRGPPHNVAPISRESRERGRERPEVAVEEEREQGEEQGRGAVPVDHGGGGEMHSPSSGCRAPSLERGRPHARGPTLQATRAG
jgi:hypothetical protein